MRFPHLLLATLCLFAAARAAEKPNLLYILADDLGYGDVKALNPSRGKIATPALDRLAREGMVFSDAHSGSSVCTPTRYGIMTGRYSWRTKLAKGVLSGDSPPLIADGRLTVAEMLRKQGYRTACIGKWHIGMEWAKWEGKPERKGWSHDFSKPIPKGPCFYGFDTFFGISASLDMPPFAYIENDRVTELPTTEKTWVRKGPAAPGFEAVDVLPALTKRTIETIAANAEASKKGTPFFIYLPLNSPHTPIVPSPEWKGKSGIGDYGDFVMQTDAAVGEILAALEKHGVAENTLVIFTSDNGCSPAAHMDALEKQGHFASQDLRGAKADIWEGGHRVPFLVRWPAKIKPGSRSATTLCHTDLMATAAELAGAKLPDNAAEDSFSFAPLLLGTGASTRLATVHHSIQGRFAIRSGKWKLSFCPGSGGWDKPGDAEARKAGLPEVQLHDLSTDLAEAKNVQAENPDVVKKLTAELNTIVAKGRSTPGAPQKNDTEVDVLKPVK